MRRYLRRVVSLLLAMAFIVGTGYVEAFAAAGCPASNSTHRVGWYTMADSASVNAKGFNATSFNMGHPCTGVPTHTLKINGQWKPAYCLTPPAYTVDGASHKCVSTYNRFGMDTPKKQAVLATILYRSEQLSGITIQSDGLIPKRGGSTQTDHWLITQLLCWALTGDNVFFQANGRIGVSPAARSDIDKAIAVVKSTRANDGAMLRGWVDSFYNQIDWMYRVPSFCSYTATHPMGEQINGKPGVTGGTGTIVLDKSCKQPDGTYKKVITDTNGVLNAFDFTGEFSPGFSGLYIEQSGSTMTITYDGSNGCWSDESQEVKRKLPTGSGSVAFWQAVADPNGAQTFSTYVPSQSELGCKLKVEIKDGTITSETPGEWTTTPSATTTPGDTPDIPTDTPETSTPAPKTPEVYLRKQSDDGNVAGFVFTITGNGETYHKVTDENGFIDLSDLPQYIPGTQQLIEYHVEEEIPVEYIHDKDNASKNFVLEPGKPVYLDFMNKRKMWRLSFKKHDSNLATQAQGKGSLAGAIFAVYKDGDQVGTYVTDETGSITTDYFPCGSGYTLVEIQSPVGYVGNPTVYAIGLMPGETLEQYNDCNRMEPLDGDDPEVIRRAYSIQSALEYKASSEMYESQN